MSDERASTPAPTASSPETGSSTGASGSTSGSASGSASPSVEPHAFGTFGGVFTPTLMTILGVIMYLRVGWVVGNAGIFGGLLIILISFGIATLTALSMASVTTNIRIGTGGAYAIICQSLGLEVGGAVGIPRYLSQALAITLYVFGFRHGLLAFFPEIAPYAFFIDVGALLVLFAIAYVSSEMAVKAQYVLMLVIAGSLVSVVVAAYHGSMQHPLAEAQLWGSFPGAPEDGFSGTSFWGVFAVFFPGATGIMAGGMTGSLKNPRRSIPRGTLAALGVALVIYLMLAYWLARSASPRALVNDYYLMIGKAAWPPVVALGLLGAAFSSALATTVGAGRTLLAMGRHGLVPYSGWVARCTARGEPHNALLVTGAIAFGALFLRELNALAPLITLFFLITYFMLNVVLMIEQGVGLTSFRPLWRVPLWVPVAGTIGCLVVMFIVNPLFSIVAVVVTGGFYALLLRRHLNAPFEDVRSGLFVAVAEWAAQRAQELPDMQERAWKPNLLVPVRDEHGLRGLSGILQALTAPNGSLKIVGLGHNEDEEDEGEGEQRARGPGRRRAGRRAGTSNGAADEQRAARRGGQPRRSEEETHERSRKAKKRSSKRRRNTALSEHLTQLTHAFRRRGIFATSTVIDAQSYDDGLIAGMQAMRGTFFKPNAVFLEQPEKAARASDLRLIVSEADREGIGTLLYAPHPEAALGQRQSINVWIHDRSPDWQIKKKIGNLDLMVLIAYRLSQHWHARLRFITVVDSDEKETAAHAFMKELRDRGRFSHAELCVGRDRFDHYLGEAPQADLSVFGLLPAPDFDFCRSMVHHTRSTCLFVRDSGQESALA